MWDRLASNKFKNRKFVVTYNLHHDKTLDSYAQKLAQAKGLELLNISYNWHDIIRPGKLVWCPSVEEYLGLIRDSFYPEKASMRIRDILSKLDIPQRGTEGEVTIRDIEKDIDYETIDKKLNAYRVQDKAYLEKVCNSLRIE